MKPVRRPGAAALRAVLALAVFGIGLSLIGAAGDDERRSPQKVIPRPDPEAPVRMQPRPQAAPVEPRTVEVDVNALRARIVALEQRVRELERHTHQYQDGLAAGNSTITLGQLRGVMEDGPSLHYSDERYFFLMSPGDGNAVRTERTNPPD